ncbi:histidine phosphatase family protein [Alicyclobacillus mengziensis]|uniref:Histidine phosphatase family protein n=1 Tax=Alicyclobacillus mengziensis TaxID=2931921 RepID=A0A9X7Z639_9BACL|nr:histidine phosphatase family protein [Alicyclobacillus mengziensis]QSO45890.1 histidine phosphatase family protein [Alicyclobacillus mengziensis]
MLELWVVRHGQTDWNLDRRIQGWTDVPLNNAGRIQAKKLGKHLEGIPFTALYTSDLLRARTTAAILQQHTGAPVTVDKRLREKYFGALEGKVRATPHPTTPAISAAKARCSRLVNDSKYRAALTHPLSARASSGDPEAESDHALQERICAFLGDVRAHFTSGRILVVTHGGLIRALLDLVGYPDRDALENTSVTRLRHKTDFWQPVAVNCADHLQLLTTQTDNEALGYAQP